MVYAPQDTAAPQFLLKGPPNGNIVTGKEAEFDWTATKPTAGTSATLDLQPLSTQGEATPTNYRFVAGLLLRPDNNGTCKGVTIHWSIPGSKEFPQQDGMLGPGQLTPIQVEPIPGSSITTLTIKAEIVGNCTGPVTTMIGAPRLIR